MTNIKVLDHLAVVNLDVHIWTARKKLASQDLGGAELPPEDLASLGSKRICNPDDLRIFGTLKARAVSLLDKNGIRFLSGWAVPETRMDEIAIELGAIRDDFNKAKEAFLQRYDQAVQDWIASHPQWAGIIAGSTVSEDYVRSRLDFRWQLFRVQTPNPSESEKISGSLQGDLDNLGSTLFDEVAKAAREAWIRCYAGKTEITRKALSPLKSIYDKLFGLTFVEPRVAPVAELLDTAFKSIPRRGAIRGNTLIMLQGLVSLLQHPGDLMEHGQMILDGRKNAGTILDSLLGGIQPASSSQEETDEEADAEVPVFLDEFTPPVIESHGLW
ncbi:DUF3150 domain-containing protein [Desulfovibrio sp. OttesenSCG-928-C14]|nr:DUF3150 domain-containing protein [Desulfovibrio sp. OttesenSCG-928-C14]